jgi:hypothetical protein
MFHISYLPKIHVSLSPTPKHPMFHISYSQTSDVWGLWLFKVNGHKEKKTTFIPGSTTHFSSQSAILLIYLNTSLLLYHQEQIAILQQEGLYCLISVPLSFLAIPVLHLLPVIQLPQHHWMPLVRMLLLSLKIPIIN